VKVIEILDAYLLDREKLTEKTSHWVTDATRCRRALVYRWRQTPYSDPPSAGNLLKMAYGNASEWIVGSALDWAASKGLIAAWKGQEYDAIQVPGLKYPVSMRMDFVVRLPDGREEMVELKSTFGRGAKELQRDGRPKDDALMQAFLYLYFHRNLVGGTIPHLARDNGYRTEFDIRLDGERFLLNGRDVGSAEDGIRWVIGRLKVVEEALESGNLPERDHYHAVKNGELRDEFTRDKITYKSDWQCRYCWHRSLCWRDVIEDQRAGRSKDNAAMRKG